MSEPAKPNDPALLIHLGAKVYRSIMRDVPELVEYVGAPLTHGFPLDAAVVCDDPECAWVHDGANTDCCPRCGGRARTHVTRLGAPAPAET